MFRPRLSISTQAYRVNGFSHGYSTSPNALAMDGRGDSALSGLIIILGPHSQGVALGYLIPPLWGLKLITLSHILLDSFSTSNAYPHWGLKLITLTHILLDSFSTSNACPHWGLKLITLTHILLDSFSTNNALPRWGLKLVSLLPIIAYQESKNEFPN